MTGESSFTIWRRIPKREKTLEDGRRHAPMSSAGHWISGEKNFLLKNGFRQAFPLLKRMKKQKNSSEHWVMFSRNMAVGRVKDMSFWQPVVNLGFEIAVSSEHIT